MSAPLLTTDALVRRVHDSAEAYAAARLETMRSQPGNPRGLVIERFGSAIAPACPAMPELDFLNRVMNLRAADANRLPEIGVFYRRLGIRPWFELLPGDEAEPLAEGLTAIGASQIGFHAGFHGSTDPLARAAAGHPGVPGVEVRPVAGPDDERAFADAVVAGFDIPVEERAAARRDMLVDPPAPSWRRYVATTDGRPVAGAVLNVVDGVGYLANAATVPDGRGRGCQGALIRRRILDAADAGCDLITSLATFGSASHRNMERAGLGLTYTLATWRVRPDA
jgi:hypothetical protein